MDDIKIRVEKALEKFKIDEKRKLIREIEAESVRPDFWKDHQKASSKMKELSALVKEVQTAETLSELIKTGQLDQVENILNDFELLLYFSGPYDSSSAILALHAGQGGVEAMDWTNMLFRMYTRFFEKKQTIRHNLQKTSARFAIF